MKPFNLKEYLKNPSRKVVTRDGELARIICTDRPDDNLPIAALVTDKEGYSGVYFFFNNGQYVKDKPSGLDLFFATTECIKKVAWTYLFIDNNKGITCTYRIFESKEEAENADIWKESLRFFPQHFKIVKIEWDENETI